MNEFFSVNLDLPLFFHCKKVDGLFFTQKKSFRMKFLMGKKYMSG